MLPLADYERITQTIKTVLDSEDATTAHSCQFFALMGATILIKHYQMAARPVFGAAFVLLNESPRDILTYGMLNGNNAVSDSEHYHAWIDTGECVIDFMAPLYGDVVHPKGYMKEVPRLMLQRPKKTIADHHYKLQIKGDCHFLPNQALSQYMLHEILKVPMYRDLIEITTRWYRKPPHSMAPFETVSSDGTVRRAVLDQLCVTGSWI